MLKSISLILLTLSIVTVRTYAYDVYLKNGTCYKSVSVTTLNMLTVINTGSRIDTVESSRIDRIVLSESIDKNAPTVVPPPQVIITPTPSASISPKRALNSAEAFNAFAHYESEKKEKSMGFILTLIFPGGGLFYADDPGSGLIFLLAHAGVISWLASSNRDNVAAPILSLLALRLWEGATVRADIDDYNSALRERLFIDKTILGHNKKLISIQIDM